MRTGYPVSGSQVRKHESLDRFEHVTSNSEACRQALAFLGGSVRNAAIFGAQGWGKSHILRAAGSALGVDVLDIREKRPNRLPDAPVLVLDDVDACEAQPKRRQEIRLELEWRLRSRKRTLVVLSGTDRTARSFLPSPRSWKLVRLNDPSDAERLAIVRRMCSNEGLELSCTSVELVSRLVRGDGHSLFGALRRLRAGADGHSASLHPLRVAGLLHPYLLDNSECDLRDIVLDQVARSSGTDARRHTELAVFALAEVAGLSEGSVASYFGIRPGDVYRICRTGRSRRETDMVWRSQVDRIVYNTASYLCEA